MAMVDKTETRVLVLCDDQWHSAQTARLGLKPIEKNGTFTFDYIEDTQDWSEEKMMEYQLVILTKSNNVSSTNHAPWMTSDVENAFLNYFHTGNGLLIIHSGTADYRECSVLRGITGGAFASHPEQCEITVTPKTQNPFKLDLASFTIFDEHYMMDLDDKSANVFLTTSSEHGVQPAGWTRNEGSGRVCVLTPGHNLEVWLHPSYQELINKALFWCRKLT
jgi:uncharacterized protein